MVTYKAALQTDLFVDIEGFFNIEQMLFYGEEAARIRLNKDQAKWLIKELRTLISESK